jgi:hypothetical protein
MKKILLNIFVIIALSTHAQNTIEKHFGDTVACSGINVIQTFDEGFLITANKNPVSQYEDDLFIIRTNQIGDTLWTKTIPFESGVISKGLQTFDSGYVFTGRTDKYLLMYKVNSLGDSLWTKKYNFGTTYSFGRSVIEASDHSLYVVGENFIGTNICCTPLVIRTDVTGNILTTINLPISFGRAYDIIETPDSNLIVSYSEIWNSPPIPKLAKIRKNGSLIWNKTYSNYCQCNVNLTHDGGYMISGSQINTLKPYLIKTDSAGNVIWNKSSSDYLIYNDKLKVTQSNDDGYLMVGGLNIPINDLILLKVSSLGDSVWGRVFGGIGDDFGNSVITTKDNGFAIVGYTRSFSAAAIKEVYFLKTDSLGLITSNKKYQTSEKQIKLFPNPFSSSTTLQTSTKYKKMTLSIFNSFGQEVKQFNNISGNSFTFNRDNLPSGIYFLRLTQENELIEIAKFVIIDN